MTFSFNILRYTTNSFRALYVTAQRTLCNSWMLAPIQNRIFHARHYATTERSKSARLRSFLKAKRIRIRAKKEAAKKRTKTWPKPILPTLWLGKKSKN